MSWGGGCIFLSFLYWQKTLKYRVLKIFSYLKHFQSPFVQDPSVTPVLMHSLILEPLPISHCHAVVGKVRMRPQDDRDTWAVRL